MKKHIIYAYGTLRPGIFETVEVPGVLYNLGWYPGAKLGEGHGKPGVPGPTFTCEKIEVESLDAVDKYEGYSEKYPEQSLYIRRPYKDGWIYEYNGEVNPLRAIESGDWLDYTKEKRGQNAGRF